MDEALAEIDRLPGRHLYFLDDHLFAHAEFAAELFEGMRGMGRVWQAAATVEAILRPGLLEKAAAAGLRSLFVGFETLNSHSLKEQHKYQNLNRDYSLAIRRLREHGVMVNGSFVYGMDHDDETVFDRTVDWAIAQGIETATFHILTPYPGTPLYTRMTEQQRITDQNWDRYDTRHAVYRPMNMSQETLETGYWQSYQEFYRWGAIFRSAGIKENVADRLRHLIYTIAWKKAEPCWDVLIRAKQVNRLLPMLEKVLTSFGYHWQEANGQSNGQEANGQESEVGERVGAGGRSPLTEKSLLG